MDLKQSTSPVSPAHNCHFSMTCMSVTLMIIEQLTKECKEILKQSANIFGCLSYNIVIQKIPNCALAVRASFISLGIHISLFFVTYIKIKLQVYQNLGWESNIRILRSIFPYSFITMLAQTRETYFV